MRSFALIDPAEISALATWLADIPWTEWPQQPRLHPDKIRPAFVQESTWHGFYARTDDLVHRLTATVVDEWPGSRAFGTRNRWLSVVMPGAGIDEHRDVVPSDRLARVHVPITSNDRALFIVDGIPRVMTTGYAYVVNTSQPHAIRNDGPTPRVHLIFDVYGVHP